MTPESSAARGSLFDRLVQPDDGARDPLRQLTESVRRDLEDLLNTPRRCQSPPRDLPGVGVSLIAYGVPDFLSLWAAAPVFEADFRNALEWAIRTYEPRLTKVAVRLDSRRGGSQRTLMIQISGSLLSDPPLPVVYASYFDPEIQIFSVQSPRR